MTTGRFERRTSYIWYCYPVTEVRKFLFTGLLICDNSASKTQYHAVLTTPDKWRFVGCSEPWKVNVCISQYKSEATGRVFPGRIWRISSYDIWIVNEETWWLEAIKNKQNGKNHETYFFSNSNLAKKLITKRIEKSKSRNFRTHCACLAWNDGPWCFHISRHIPGEMCWKIKLLIPMHKRAFKL